MIAVLQLPECGGKINAGLLGVQEFLECSQDNDEHATVSKTLVYTSAVVICTVVSFF